MIIEVGWYGWLVRWNVRDNTIGDIIWKIKATFPTFKFLFKLQLKLYPGSLYLQCKHCNKKSCILFWTDSSLHYVHCLIAWCLVCLFVYLQWLSKQNLSQAIWDSINPAHSKWYNNIVRSWSSPLVCTPSTMSAHNSYIDQHNLVLFTTLIPIDQTHLVLFTSSPSISVYISMAWICSNTYTNPSTPATSIEW